MFVKIWMKKDPVVVVQEQTLAEADALMRQHAIRRLPVVETDNKLIGIITREDIVKAVPVDPPLDDSVIGAQVPVAAFMTASPITVDPMDPLETVSDIMCKNRIGGLPVVSPAGELIGIITESDICRALTDILGVQESGARIELQIGKDAADFYETFRIFKEFNMLVISVALYPGFSENYQLLTVRLQGEEMEKMMDALWKSGVKIHRAMVDQDNG